MDYAFTHRYVQCPCVCVCDVDINLARGGQSVWLPRRRRTMNELVVVGSARPFPISLPPELASTIRTHTHTSTLVQQQQTHPTRIAVMIQQNGGTDIIRSRMCGCCWFVSLHMQALYFWCFINFANARERQIREKVSCMREKCACGCCCIATAPVFV